MLNYLAILLFIFAEMIFSEYAPDRSTNWSIFYFSSTFISLLIVSASEMIRAKDLFYKSLLDVCIIFFFLLLIQQLALINKPYEIYYESVNNDFIDFLRHIFFIISIIIISFKYLFRWAKKPRKQ